MKIAVKFFIIVLILAEGVSGYIEAQVRATSTPIPVVLPTQTALPTEISISTPTPTITPTEQGFVLLRASSDVDSSIPINVRRLPDPTSEVVGFLDRNTEYVVTGRYISWWEIEYDTGGGKAWVFNTVVELPEDTSDVPTVDPFEEPTATPFTINSQATISAEDFAATLAVITQTPDAILTVTAQQRVIDLPEGTPVAVVVLPTFTPPPDSELARDDVGFSEAGNDELSQAVNTLLSGQLPPIFPILLLAGAGIIGLLISQLFQRG